MLIMNTMQVCFLSILIKFNLVFYFYCANDSFSFIAEDKTDVFVMN